MTEAWRIKAARTYRAIKRFYLQHGRTEEQWQAITADPRKFNRVWRAMLRLPSSDMPPPKGVR